MYCLFNYTNREVWETKIDKFCAEEKLHRHKPFLLGQQVANVYEFHCACPSGHIGPLSLHSHELRTLHRCGLALPPRHVISNRETKLSL